jgi:hypothetical protein
MLGVPPWDIIGATDIEGLAILRKKIDALLW